MSRHEGEPTVAEVLIQLGILDEDHNPVLSGFIREGLIDDHDRLVVEHDLRIVAEMESQFDVASEPEHTESRQAWRLENQRLIERLGLYKDDSDN